MRSRWNAERGILCGAISVFFLCPVPGRADGNEVPGGVAGVASREVVKRQDQVKTAQTLFATGATALADKSYGEAMDYFKAAFETMPPVPAVETQRRVFFRRYQSAALDFANLKIEEARWAEAVQTLEEILRIAEDHEMPASLVDPQVRAVLEDLETHDDRFNQAMSPQHLERVNEVESNLILAHGYLELGDYDRAARSYQQVLAVDPYNEAARRGLEKVERHRMDYFDAARDQTRAKKLAEVAAGWESPVPQLSPGEGMIESLPDVELGGSPVIEEKLTRIRIPSIELVDARLGDVIDFLVQKSIELDTTETDPSRRGVNILIDSGVGMQGAAPRERIVTIKLRDVPLAVALKYATQQVGMKYRVDDFAVRIVPLTDSGEGGLVTRTYSVPPGFIGSTGPGDAGGGGPADPFADPEPVGGVQLERLSAKEFLESNGIVFPEGASARFITSTSTLVVRNTPEQMLSIENLIQTSRESGGKMVMVAVKMISVKDTALRQIGMDFLLGAANVGGGTPRVFAGGGTDGTSANPTLPVDYPFVLPGGAPVGLNPVTAGLRTGDLSSGVSIDDLVSTGVAPPGSTKAPGVFSIAGVFTDPQFQLVLRALSQLKGADVLDDTKVLTKPGQRAEIERAREFIYPTEYDPPEIPTTNNVVGLIAATPATPTAFEMRRLGSVVEVEPTVSADNLTVNVNILADFSEFVGFINYGTPIVDVSGLAFFGNSVVVAQNRILMPVFDAVKETTNVTVWDGQTIAIGGYHGESVLASQDKVPYIGDLPVIGKAFRSKTRSSTKRALLLFVTVKLVDPGGNPLNAPLDDEQPEMMTRREGLPGSGVTSAPAALPAGGYPAK